MLGVIENWWGGKKGRGEMYHERLNKVGGHEGVRGGWDVYVQYYGCEVKGGEWG